jgi:ketosteroid isomerase-like protein
MRLSRLPALAAGTALLISATGALAADAKDEAAVRQVLQAYQAAVQKLDLTGTEPLFSKDARVFEQGGDEGSYPHYVEHHLRPELAEFSRFDFSDYKAEVRFEGPLAVAHEVYKYRIVLKEKPGEAIDRLGVATVLLRKEGADWKILQHHSSSRKPPAK